MRRKTIIILVIVFAGGIFSGLFIPRLLNRDRVLPPIRFISRYLSLSESQKKEMESLTQLFDSKVEKIRTELDEKRAELSEMLGETSPDQEKIQEKGSEISSLQAEFQTLTITHLEEIRSLLTPQQQTKFFSLIRKRLHPGSLRRTPERGIFNFWKR